MCARTRSSHCIAVLQCRTVVAWRVRDLMSYAVPRAQRLGGCQSRQLPDLAQGCKVTDPMAGRTGPTYGGSGCAMQMGDWAEHGDGSAIDLVGETAGLYCMKRL